MPTSVCAQRAPRNPFDCEESYFVTTGPSNTPLNVRLAERRQQQLDALEQSTEELLNEHESALRALLSDVRRTTEAAIRDQSQHLTSALSESERRQRKPIEAIEQRLASAANQAERLSQIGSLQRWTRPLAIMVAVMLAVGAVTASGLLLTDRLIDSRLERLAMLRQEIQRAEQAPRLPQGVAIRAIEGQSYLMGIDIDTAWTGRLDNGTPVIRLTTEKEQ